SARRPVTEIYNDIQMANTRTKKARKGTEDVAARDYPSPNNPPQDPTWEREAKPEMSREERTQGLPTEKLRQMAYDMLLARRFEEKAAEAYALGKIGGFCHLYIGQEAVAIGAIHALEEGDYTMTAYREHAHALQMGMDPGVAMA